MKLAIALSHDAIVSEKEGQFGCVLVRHGEIIGKGYNAVTGTNDSTADTQIIATRAACNRLQSFQLIDCEIFTFCEPCPVCLGANYWAKLEALYYANTKEDAAEMGFDDGFICE